MFRIVFIVGPPRSGTTWLLKLLGEHPCVALATTDNLHSRVNNIKTLETNIFNTNRFFSDEQIYNKFQQLAKDNSGKTIVEKTPIHLMFLDRIMRIFPEAKIILMERDGRDVVTSLVHAGRDPKSWWKGAPATVEDATKLWKRYIIAAERCRKSFSPGVVSYEKLLKNTVSMLREILYWIGLSDYYIEQQIKACHKGKNIEIPGVYREGKIGSWKNFFSKEDLATFERIAGEYK